MRFNFNKIINEKYALKAYPRGIKENKLHVDLNGKISLALNLPECAVYPQVVLGNKSVSTINPALAWKLVSHTTLNNKKASYLQKPLVAIDSVSSVFFRRSFVRKKKSFLLYREGLKGGIRSLSVRTRFLHFSKKHLINANISNKIYFLNLHKNNSFIFQRPKVSCISSKLYTAFNRQTKTLNKNLNVDFFLVDKKKLHSSLLKRIRKERAVRVFKSNNKKISKRLARRKIRVVINTKVGRRFKSISRRKKELAAKKRILIKTISKKVKSFLASDPGLNIRDTHIEIDDNKSLELNFISKKKQLLKNYLKLNDTNKEKIKKSIKATSIAFFRSDIAKIRKEQFNKHTIASKRPNSKGFKRLYKRKIKNFIGNNTKTIIRFYKKLRRNVSRDSAKILAERSRIKKTLPNKSKSSNKNKKSRN